MTPVTLKAGQGHFYLQTLFGSCQGSYQSNIMSLSLLVFQTSWYFRRSRLKVWPYATPVTLKVGQGHFKSQTLFGSCQGSYQPHIMSLSLSVVQKKSFEGFDIFDTRDLESRSRSFLFANFVRLLPRKLPLKYHVSRPFSI